MFFLVFGSVRRPLMGGGKYLDWSNDQNPLGVYQGDTAEDACKAAAAESATMGTFFAIEGTPWGLELMDNTGTRFGSTASPLDSLDKRLAQIADREAKRDKLLTQLLAPADED